MEACRSWRVIVINHAYRFAPWADMLYACDGRWWEEERPTFAGLKVSQDARVKELRSDVLIVPSVAEPGLSLDPLRIHQGGNSGYQALNLAVLLGAARVVLVGFDMRLGPNRRPHWHGWYPQPLNNPDESNCAGWRAAFATTLPDLARAGVEVLNATPGSALECFPRVNLEDLT